MGGHRMILQGSELMVGMTVIERTPRGSLQRYKLQRRFTTEGRAAWQPIAFTTDKGMNVRFERCSLVTVEKS
jgi:hypothetical protein